jgi:hypothetical protein
MSQAQRNQQQSARTRTSPPPLPRRSGIAPAGTGAAAVAALRLTAPPSPPMAARRLSQAPRISEAPRLSLEPAVNLAFLPQWDDANGPLRPAPKKTRHMLYWVGSAALSLTVGALIAAGLVAVRPGDFSQILPRSLSPAPTAAIQQAAVAVAPVAEQAPEVPVQVIEHEQGLEIQAEPPVAEPVLIPELTVKSSKAVAKAAERAAKKAKALAKRRGHTTAVVATSQPDPRDEAETEEVATETVSEAAPTEAAEAPVAAAPEVVVPVEPPAPALPEKLTRDQVRGGLDAVRSQVLACAGNTYGKILADVTISAPGKVSNSVIEGTFANTNAAACMTRALSNAKFAAFSGPDISVRYPFSF